MIYIYHPQRYCYLDVKPSVCCRSCELTLTPSLLNLHSRRWLLLHLSSSPPSPFHLILSHPLSGGRLSTPPLSNNSRLFISQSDCLVLSPGFAFLFLNYSINWQMNKDIQFLIYLLPIIFQFIILGRMTDRYQVGINSSNHYQIIINPIDFICFIETNDIG